MWKSSVVSASDRIFPGLACHDRKKEFFDIQNRVQSSLPLQIVLFLNVYYFPVWVLFLIYYLDAKYYELSEFYKFVSVAVSLTVVCLECTRLYLGYLGNLGERIPELASFWLISTLLQLPLELFLVFDRNSTYLPNERIANSVALAFLAVEIVTGTIVLKISADHHAKRFYMAQLYGIEDTIK
ncbi:transmembrane protein 17-like [Trichogramma pretiosum]|uniref:Transmembrane protein 17 n=1 Tax=Trichogramma kaykai TaxID=54128 RepID=A0ABD2XDL8_9HYME|nr:transmembrane protein 17-like [Trichogramma pretiosum]